MKTKMKDAIQHALNTQDEAWIEQRFMTGDTAFDVMVMDLASVYRGTHGGEHYYAALLFTPVVTYTKEPISSVKFDQATTEADIARLFGHRFNVYSVDDLKSAAAARAMAPLDMKHLIDSIVVNLHEQQPMHGLIPMDPVADVTYYQSGYLTHLLMLNVIIAPADRKMILAGSDQDLQVMRNNLRKSILRHNPSSSAMAIGKPVPYHALESQMLFNDACLKLDLLDRQGLLPVARFEPRGWSSRYCTDYAAVVDGHDEVMFSLFDEMRGDLMQALHVSSGLPVKHLEKQFLEPTFH